MRALLPLLVGACAVAATWVLTLHQARASDTHAHTAPAAAASAVSRNALPPVSAASAVNVDPLEALQRRLAQRLGAQREGSAGAQNIVLRVPTKADAATVTPQAAPPRRAKAAAPAAGHAEHWSYEGGGGPEAWARLKPEFATCSGGKRQSPIDIRDGIKVALDPVQFDYQLATFRVIDNGHTVQVNVAPGSGLEVMGQRYELQQFHFHRPSEERIDGRQFDMVVHLVHKSLEGRLAVVAVLLERGAVQPLLQQVWANLPLERGDEVRARGTLDLNQLLPTERGYFTYMGSLTTPPCSEGVLWLVLKQPVQVSPDQIAIFARLYPMNARPIQSASGRLIKESN